MISRDGRFLQSVATALRRAKIDAVVIGNTASVLNGAKVMTEDVDLLIRDTPQNQRKLKVLAAELGGAIVPIADKTRRIMGPMAHVDVLFDKIPGAGSFATVKSHARQQAVGTEVLTVASLEDVIKSKEAVGRPKDRAVLPFLKDTLRVRKSEES
jgi:hypothetical protein